MPTAAELNAPKYKVIAPYPNSVYIEGQTLSLTSTPALPASFTDGTHIEDYPKIFRLMFWYEEVAVEDLPLRLKNTRTEDIYDVEPGSYNFTEMPLLPFAFSVSGDTLWLNFHEAADPAEGS